MFKKKFLQIISILFYFQFFYINYAYSDSIKNFVIQGNDRVSDETIIMFSNLDIGENFDQDKLNDALKELYFTDYFSDVSISEVDGIIFIKVNENPIIQTISVNGIKKDLLLENIKKITTKLEKYPFNEARINEQTILLKNILKSYGYYFVKLNTSVKKNDNNTVDLIYDFTLGEIAKIKKIKFIGDKIFKDRVLRNVILSEETKFWKFLTKNKFIDSNRINLDVDRLTKFYKNKGFFNVKVKSTTAVVTNDQQFELIFNIDSGSKFYVNKVIFNNLDNNLLDTIKIYQNKFNKLEGKKYSYKSINNLIEELNNFTLENDFIFLNAGFTEKALNNNLIDIIINFDELDKIFVDRINIFGNYITDEKVLRNNLIVDEGDPYNEILINKSIQNLKALNIFKSIDYKTNDNIDQNKIVNLTVEEKPTGEIFAGAGTGTTGSSITAGIKENNYLGLGIKLDTNFTLTDDSLKGKFSALNPNYKNSDKSLKTEFESSTDDFLTVSGYKTSRLGFSLGTEFEQKNDLFVNLEVSNFYEDLETSSSATDIIKRQEGNYIENLLSYTISYNKLDQNFQPSDGFINRFSQTLPIYSDDSSIENSFTSAIYQSIDDNLILSAKFYLQTINSFDDNVRVSKRVFIPGNRLRGFEVGKIGPKDGVQYIGGNYASALNLGSTLPNILFENEDIDLNFFLDLANLWEVDYNSELDSNKLRSSVGLAVNWFSAIGPLTFSYAVPLSEANTDITERFRFQIGTSF